MQNSSSKNQQKFHYRFGMLFEAFCFEVMLNVNKLKFEGDWAEL